MQHLVVTFEVSWLPGEKKEAIFSFFPSVHILVTCSVFRFSSVLFLCFSKVFHTYFSFFLCFLFV